MLDEELADSQVTFDAGSIYSPVPFMSLTSTASRFAATQGSFVHQAEPKSWNVQGHKLHQYFGPQGSSTFWRFFFEIPLLDYEQQISYRLNGGGVMGFLVPARGVNLRWSAHSCNGFSAGVDVDSFKGEGFESGFDPLWEDMLEQHEKFGLHAQVG